VKKCNNHQQAHQHEKKKNLKYNTEIPMDKILSNREKKERGKKFCGKVYEEFRVKKQRVSVGKEKRERKEDKIHKVLRRESWW